MLTSTGCDNAFRWREGERLDHLFEAQCDRLTAEGRADRPAVDGGDGGSLSFRRLDGRANQLARCLLKRGLGGGDRIGLIFDRSLHTYVALLAVLKINAAYVPLDPGFPTERIGFIAQDAGLAAILTLAEIADAIGPLEPAPLLLDRLEAEIDPESDARLDAAEKPSAPDPLCYVIYTSGTTGNPKGVAVDHPSICNFVRVANEVYGYRESDRVFQGMTIAFDFSVEELWVPLLAGATLVPGRPGGALVGRELADYLAERRITALACVPTLLATLDPGLPKLRLLLLSGEACPPDLAARWRRPGRVILNAYGPTEATVTATVADLTDPRPVTIGMPLPSYAIVILDPNADEEIEDGAVGEIGIAGIGVARGYLNRPELTARKFIRDFLALPNNPSGRIYRTGDLGRITPEGEVDFLGRIDTQVKIRGYRIELSEIESVLMRAPEIAVAVVDTFEPTPGAVELVAYFTLREGAAEPSRSTIAHMLRASLPKYMVPAYLERLDAMPMLPSNKADRKRLPPPRGPRLVAGGESFVAPSGEWETAIAETLGEILGVERVSAHDNFFDDLGAHSLLMARFCARLRHRMPGSDPSMPAIYRNPTVAKLAARLSAGAEPEDASPDPTMERLKRLPPRRASWWSYYGCGALQLGWLAVVGMAMIWAAATGLEWAFAAPARPEVYLRLTGVAGALILAATLLPVALKWLLIGRWKEQVIPVWSLRYLVFWIVRGAVRASPLTLFAGSPLYNVHLRMLGARIGRDVVILSRLTPVCADLLEIGDNVVLRKDSILLGYRAQSGYLFTGSHRLGSNVFVGESSLLEIGTTMEDGAQLGHSSSLRQGQTVPAGQHWHGSPGRPCAANFQPIEPAPVGPARKLAYSALQLALLLGLAPAALGASDLVSALLGEQMASVMQVSEVQPAATGWSPRAFLPLALVASAALLLARIVLGLIAVALVPRLPRPFLREGRTYKRYGLRHMAQSAMSMVSNSPFFNVIFGDSALIVHYLRWIGWRLPDLVQTGSNLGMYQRHENPFLCEVGGGTIVSDTVAMMNAHMTGSSFRLEKVRIGARNFLGNYINIPPRSRVGDNCLLGTKVMVPLDGEMRENVGLLGSPSFEIPRAVERDKAWLPYAEPERRAQRIRAKLGYNAASIALYLGALWLHGASLMLTGRAAYAYYGSIGAPGVFGLMAASGLFTILYFAFLERAGLGFRPLRPRMVSIYDPYFWLHERHWKFNEHPVRFFLKGTPFANWISRLFGVRVGRRVFDDGCQFVEKTMISIGDHCTLGAGSVFFCHSLEEGVFKSDRVVMGAGCTLGAGALVHYGASIGDGATLHADSYLMKGETLEPGSEWRGNPAKAGRRAVVAKAVEQLGKRKRRRQEAAAKRAVAA